MSTTEQSMNPSGTDESPISIPKKIALGFFFVMLLVFFTLTKLPQSKITALIQGMVQTSLDPYGIYITDHGRELSIWKGFEYRLNQPSIELPDQSRIELDSLVISPKIASLFTGKIGAVLEVVQEKSKLNIEGTIRGDLVDGTLKFDAIDLGKFGLLSFAGGIKGGGQLTGDIHIDGHLADLPSLAGNIDLKLKHIHLEDQNLFGFHLPDMDVNDGIINATINQGKVSMKQFVVGKGNDDLQLTLTGDISLNRNINSSNLNLRAVIGLSEKVRQSIPLLDTLLGSAKQGDGKYVYKLTGSFMAPMPMPDPQK